LGRRQRGPGIVQEISYQAIIRDNTVLQNGRLTPASLDGAGIMIASSPNAAVFQNTVVRSADGIALKQHSTGSGDRGAYVVRDAFVHDNLVLMCNGETGGIQTVGDDALFTSRNNRFDRHTYLFAAARPESWRWLNDFRTRSEWTGFGHDRHGTFRTVQC
jgi:hypothetical protein